jgi:hypothetical protein
MDILPIRILSHVLLYCFDKFDIGRIYVYIIQYSAFTIPLNELLSYASAATTFMIESEYSRHTNPKEDGPKPGSTPNAWSASLLIVTGSYFYRSL